jgi:WD domain, G-beta repeat
VLDIPGMESAIEVSRSDLKFTGAGVEVRDDSRALSGQAIRIPGNAPDAGIRFRVPESCRKARAHGWSFVVALRVERAGFQGPAFEFSLHAPAGRRAQSNADSISVPDDNYHLWLCDIHEVKALLQHDWLDATITIPAKSASAAVWIDCVYVVPFKRQSGNMTLRQEHLTFAPDGGRLWGVVDSDHVVSWKLPYLQVASHGHDFINASLLGYARIDSLAVGRKWVLAGNERGETILLSAATGEKEKSWLGADGGVRAVALHPSETMAAVGTQKGNLRLIRIPSGEVIATLPRHEQGVESICFSRDGQLLVTGSLDQTVRLMRRSGNGYELLVALKQPTGRIASVRLSPDNTKLAVLADPERAVRIWRLDRLRDRLAAAGLDW